MDPKKSIIKKLNCTHVIQFYHVSVVISLGEDPPEVSFHHQGYLFLSPEDRAENLIESVKMQKYGKCSIISNLCVNQFSLTVYNSCNVLDSLKVCQNKE